MYSIIAPIRRCRLEIVAHLSVLVMSRREENPMCIVCIAFARTSSKSVLSKASTVFEEVNAPSAHGAECQTCSPLRTLCDAKLSNKTYEQNVESVSKPLFRFTCFCPFFASNLSAHERISVASGRSACHCFWQFSQYGGERGKSYIRSLSHTQSRAKTMYEATLRHATTQFSSRNALTAIQIPQTTLCRVRSKE